MKARYVKFGETRMVPLVVYLNGNKVADPEGWDIELWVEDATDMYALSSQDWRDKHVRVIERSAWLQSPKACRTCTICPEFEEHHWMIHCDEDTPKGKLVCRHCPAERELTLEDIDKYA